MHGPGEGVGVGRRSKGIIGNGVNGLCSFNITVVMFVYYFNPGAAPGCLLGGGGGQNVATAARGKQFTPAPEKVTQRGGLRHIFFSDFKQKLTEIFIMG